MPLIEILNPQDPIPEVKSYYTIISNTEVDVDLNEDSWAKDYFVIFFHTGPSDPVSTSILRDMDARNETLPFKVSPLLSMCPHPPAGYRRLHGHHPRPLLLAGHTP